MNIGSVYKELKYNIIYKIIIYSLLGLLVLIPILIQMLNPVVFCDSAYYLSISNRITEGYKLYNDVACGYTPLYMYICAFYKNLFNITYNLYWPYLLLQQLFRIGCAFWVFGIVREFKVSVFGAVLSAFYCLFIYVRVESTACMLEVPSAFWGLGACYAVLRICNGNSLHYLWIGMLLSFSFLTKQYGLGFLPLVLFLLFTHTRKELWLFSTMNIMVGFITPIILSYFYFGSAYISALLPTYGTKSAVDAGFNWSIMDRIVSILLAIMHSFKTNSIVMAVSFFLFPLALKAGLWKNWIFAALGFFGFSLQFFFTNNSDGHYLLYMFPFVSIMIGNLMVLKCKTVIKRLVYLLMLYMILYQGYLMYYKYVPHWLYDKSDITYHMQVTNICNEYIPMRSLVWIEPITLEAIYFHANIIPPNISTIGYSFGPLGLDFNEALKQFESAEYIIIENGEGSYPFSSTIRDMCKDYESIPITDYLTLFKK